MSISVVWSMWTCVCVWIFVKLWFYQSRADIMIIWSRLISQAGENAIVSNMVKPDFSYFIFFFKFFIALCSFCSFPSCKVSVSFQLAASLYNCLRPSLIPFFCLFCLECKVKSSCLIWFSRICFHCSYAVLVRRVGCQSSTVITNHLVDVLSLWAGTKGC